MRILHAMECTIGGTRRHLIDVATGQLARGHEVGLAVSTLRDPRFAQDLRRLETLGASVFVVPMRRQIAPLDDLRQLARLREILREYRPEIVHTHSSKAGALGRTAARLESIGRCVHTPHTFAFLFSAEFGPLRRRLFRAVETRLARHTARFVAVSQGEARSFVDSGVVPAERVRVVRNGIDPRPFELARPADRGTLSIPTDAPLILVAGLLHVAKGQDLAIRALASPGLEAAHLLCLGEGDARAECERVAAQCGVQSRVHLPGWSDDVPSWMAVADVVAVPSRWEAMPYVVLEALAAGRCVVATRVDGSREWIEDGKTGVSCAVGDANDLARALCEAISMPQSERARLAAEGRRRVRDEGSVDRMVEDLLALYAQLP